MAAYEFWRFVFAQGVVAKAAESLIDFPPMQPGSSFNMSAVKAEIDEAIAARGAGTSESHGPRSARGRNRGQFA